MKRLTWRRGAAALAAIVVALVIVDYVRLPDAEPLQQGAPPETALMRQRQREAVERGQKLHAKQRVVTLQQIAPTAVSAVVLSEDAGFYVHGGIDGHEIEAAIERALEGGKLRGASTITQQLAKNLWLSTTRSPLRKLEEVVLAGRLERALTKRRILWLYLNVVEWGDGVYGIDAGAHEHFHTDAASLTVAQGAMLAAMLPAPRTWLPAKKPNALYRRAMQGISNMEEVGKISAVQAEEARRELEAFFGRRPPEADVADEPVDAELPEPAQAPSPAAPIAPPAPVEAAPSSPAAEPTEADPTSPDAPPSPTLPPPTETQP